MTTRIASLVGACCFITVLTSAVVTAQPPSDARAERLSLEAAIKMAVANNHQLQTTRLEVEKADADLATARTRRLPQFETEMSASQLLTPVEFAFPRGAFGDFAGTGPIPSADTNVSVPRQPTYYLSSQVSQPISQLFQIGLNVRNAVTMRDIERERARAQQLSVINDVKRLYFAILQTESALAANNEAIALYRELDRTLEARVAQKVALRADALDVQLRLAQEEFTRTTRLNTLASQKEQLNQLLGRDVSSAFDVDEVAAASAFEIDPVADRTYALANRPDVREARLKLQQAELDRRITKADRIPDISLAASYTSNFNIDVLPANLATVGVRLTWEPLDWGRKGHELAAKTRVIQQARLGVRQAEDRAVVEINSRYRALAEKRALLNVARMAQSASREKLRVKTNQFQVHAALLPDVLQQRAELADADDGYQRALLGFWTAKADYELAIGEEVLQ
jgi:outer membrane protein TolC